MPRAAALLVFALASLTAAAPAVPAQARPIQAGTYELSITYGGGLLDATLEIGYAADSITAVLNLGDHQSPVKPGKRTGTKLVLEPVSPAMDVRYELEFTGETVKGTFIYQGEGGQVTGKLKKPER